MRSPVAPDQIPSRSPSIDPRPRRTVGAAVAVAVLVYAAAGFAASLVMAGCATSQLAGAKTAATVCNAVEAAAPAALYSWEQSREAPVVEKATQTHDAAAAHAELTTVRAQLDPLTAALDGLSLVCTTLSKAVKTAEASSGDVPQDVIDTVWSSVTKLVKLLLDAGVKIPPGVLQLVQQA